MLSMNCIGYASVDATRLGGKLIFDRRIPERVDARPDQSLQRADVTSKDLANANLGGTRRLVFVANHPQGHPAEISSHSPPLATRTVNCLSARPDSSQAYFALRTRFTRICSFVLVDSDRRHLLEVSLERDPMASPASRTRAKAGLARRTDFLAAIHSLSSLTRLKLKMGALRAYCSWDRPPGGQPLHLGKRESGSPYREAGRMSHMPHVAVVTRLSSGDTSR